MSQGFDPDLLAAFELAEKESGVLVSRADPSIIDRALIEGLKRYAAATARGRGRILFHAGDEDRLQQMLIAARRMTLWPPHRNEGNAKSWTVLDGEVAFVQYTPPGEIVRVVKLSSGEGDAPSHLRLTTEQWHTVVPLSEMPVYLETRPGPYAGTRFADWGPQSEDSADAQRLWDALSKLK